MKKLFENFDFRRESDQKEALRPTEPELLEKGEDPEGFKKELIEESHTAAIERDALIERKIKEQRELDGPKLTRGEIDKKMQATENKKKDANKRMYNNARNKDWAYGGPHHPVNRNF